MTRNRTRIGEQGRCGEKPGNVSGKLFVRNATSMASMGSLKYIVIE
jgi:hypothetical protein